MQASAPDLFLRLRAIGFGQRPHRRQIDSK